MTDSIRESFSKAKSNIVAEVGATVQAYLIRKRPVFERGMAVAGDLIRVEESATKGIKDPEKKAAMVAWVRENYAPRLKAKVFGRTPS